MLTHDLGQVSPKLGFLTMGHCCPYLIIKKKKPKPHRPFTVEQDSMHYGLL
jgi:hypothetical protein